MTFNDGRSLKIRLNTPYSPLITSLTAGSAGGGWADAVYADTISDGNTTQPNPLVPYSETYTTGRTLPMLTVFTELYQEYTCLETNATFTIKNMNASEGSDENFAFAKEAYSASDADVLPDLDNKWGFMDTNWDVVHLPARSPDNKNGTSITYKVNWKPNQIHRDVKNDADHKTWHLVASVPSPVDVEMVNRR